MHLHRPLLATILLPGLATALLASTAATQVEREIEAARKQILELRRKAEQLEEAGRRDAARDLAAKARDLEARLRHSASRHRHRRGNDDYAGLFDHLDHAVAILRDLGRPDAAAKVADFARDLRRDLDHRSRTTEQAEREHAEREHAEREHAEREHAEREHAEREHAERRHADRRHAQDSERQEARRQLAVMRYAKAAFREAGNERLLDLVERAMHARELALAGRRDREAMEIRKRAPNRTNQAELLLRAAKLLDDYHAAEKAAAVRRLAERLLPRRHRPGDRNPREAGEAREEVYRSTRALVGELREQLAAMNRSLEHLGALVHRLGRR